MRASTMLRCNLLTAICVSFVVILFSPLVATSEDGMTLWTFVPFTILGVDNPLYSDDLGNSLGYSHMVAARLAMDHFNSRDASVVPELGDEEFSYEQCNSFFDNAASLIFDTQVEGAHTIRSVLDGLKTADGPISAIAGPQHDRPGADLSAFASSLEIPLVAYGGMDIRVVTDYYSPTSNRVSGSALAIGPAGLSYLIHIGRGSVVSMLYVLSDSGLHIKESTLFLAGKAGSRVESRSYPVLSSKRDVAPLITDSLRQLKEIGFRTVFCVVDFTAKEIPMIADAAEELGMNNGDYFWAFVGKDSLHYYENDPAVTENANISKLLHGAVTFSDLEGFTSNPTEDRFLASWRAQNASFTERVNSWTPIEEGEPGYFTGDGDYCQTFDPLAGAGLLYDAIISIGMGRCKSQYYGDEQNVSSGTSHNRGLRAVDFHGASGRVLFGVNHLDVPGARGIQTLEIGVFNLLTTSEDGNRVVLSSTLKRIGVVDYLGTWTEVSPFIYANGTPEPPKLLRDTPEQNYLDGGFRIFGFTLMSIALFVIVASVCWIYLCRKSRVVRASQPLFLYMLCFGSSLETCSILLVSADESHGWDAEALGRFCTALPWLLTMGHVINYGALFTKLWRINKVLQFRRSRVKIKHVVWPSVLIIVLVIIMLTVYTAMGGMDWERHIIDEESWESIGKCQVDDTLAYLIPMLILVAIPTLLTIVMAWKTKDVDSAYSESSWIFALVILQVQVLIVSVPVIYIMDGQSTNAKHIVYVLLIFVFAMSNMALIIGPKVYKTHFSKGGKDKKTRGGGTGNVKVSGVNSSGREDEILKNSMQSSAEDRGVASSVSNGDSKDLHLNSNGVE